MIISNYIWGVRKVKLKTRPEGQVGPLVEALRNYKHTEPILEVLVDLKIRYQGLGYIKDKQC